MCVCSATASPGSEPDQVHQSNSLNTNQLPDTSVQPLIPSRVRKGAEISSFTLAASSQRLSCSHPASVGYSSSVDVKRRSAARVSQ
jgi:hypothetical protein